MIEVNSDGKAIYPVACKQLMAVVSFDNRSIGVLWRLVAIRRSSARRQGARCDAAFVYIRALAPKKAKTLYRLKWRFRASGRRRLLKSAVE